MGFQQTYPQSLGAVHDFIIITMGLRDILKVIATIVMSSLCAGAVAAAGVGFERVAARQIAEMTELSGLQASPRKPGLLWGLNDSGHPPELLAFDTALNFRRAILVQGVDNRDWEDLAGYEEGGQSWLVIADTGDNFGLRAEVALIFVAEPDVAGRADATPARILRFTWAEGPRDCEAVAIDLPGRRILLADKGRHPAGLYALDLDGPDQGQQARRIASFPELVPTPAPRVTPIGSSRWRGTPTAMDLSRDGRRLAVLTYQSASLFERSGEADWDQALRQPLRSERIPRLGGFEALAFEAGERSILIGSEGPTTRLERWLGLAP